MKLISYSYVPVYRAFCMILALHFFNLSIDPKDRQPDFVAEDLSLNDIESIAEFMAEVVFGLDDVFREYDEHDGHFAGPVDFFQLFAPRLFDISFCQQPVESSGFVIENGNNVLGPHRDINSPPPRA